MLPLVVSGLLNKQVAAEIGTTEATVKVHQSQFMRKMGADSLPELVRMAEKLVFLVPSDECEALKFKAIRLR